jgi:phage shock protein C
MAEEIKKFYRSRTDRVLFGVCGGLGKYFNVDPILFRLFFVLLLFVEGSGILLYLIMVLVTPEEPETAGSSERNLEKEIGELGGRIDQKAKEIGAEHKIDEKSIQESRNILGVFIVLIGLFFLARQVMPMAWLDMGIIWSLAIIAIGLYIIFKR